MLTQHQMRNIGNGNDQDSPLRYKFTMHWPGIGGRNTMYLDCISEEHADSYARRFGGLYKSVELI